MKHQSKEASKWWNIEMMKHWNDETLKRWNIETMKHWNNETLKQWNIETMKHWNDETLYNETLKQLNFKAKVHSLKSLKNYSESRNMIITANQSCLPLPLHLDSKNLYWYTVFDVDFNSGPRRSLEGREAKTFALKIV